MNECEKLRAALDELLAIVWTELGINDGACIHRLKLGDCAVCGRVKEIRATIALRESAVGVEARAVLPVLTRRRDVIERKWPDDEHLRMGLRQFDPGPWIYELSHPDGTVETLTEQRYRELRSRDE